MINLKELVTQSITDHPDFDCKTNKYKFNEPATPSEVSDLASHIKLEIPDELRKLFYQFNGVVLKDEFFGWKSLLLSIQEIIHDIPDYIENSGNDMPASEHLSKVCFFAQQNGYSMLYAICCTSFNKFTKGEILKLNVELADFEYENENLMSFIKNGDHFCLG